MFYNRICIFGDFGWTVQPKIFGKKWIYYLAVLLHTILNTVEALIGYPLLNVCYSLGILCIGSALLYDTEKKDIIVNSVVIVIYVATIDFLVTTIFLHWHKTVHILHYKILSFSCFWYGQYISHTMYMPCF